MLLYLAHADNAKCKNEQCGAYRDAAVLHAPTDRLAKGVVGGGVKHFLLLDLILVRYVLNVVRLFKQQATQVRHK